MRSAEEQAWVAEEQGVMADLIAQGSDPDHRWRYPLKEGETQILGRTAGWRVPWDPAISGKHLQLSWQGQRLKIRRLATATNPVFYQGQTVEQMDLHPGEHFVIGSTVFTLSDDQVDVTLEAPQPTRQRRYSRKQLHQLAYADAGRRLQVLSQLPDMIDRAVDQTALFQCLANVLLSGIPSAEAVGLVAESAAGLKVLKWDRRRVTGEPFAPSRRLVQQALDCGESLLYSWRDEDAKGPTYTLADEFTWAFACPVLGESTTGWCLYVTGKEVPNARTAPLDGDDVLQEDVKFAELVASILGRLLKLRRLERDQLTLRQFFSPTVLDAVAGQNPEEVLAPRETDVTVLFCDLREFSRQSEQAAADLRGLLEQVSKILGITTQHILQQSGVIGDFHGDAVMGFWGWPLAGHDGMERACQAALAIRQALESLAHAGQPSLAAYELGMGIATGRAVAGKIGTKDQVKVTVFGPVVNLAARLESMTRQVRAPILIDASTARGVRERLDPTQARVRRVAVVRPWGLDQPVEIYELLPPMGSGSELSDRHIEAYERAWEQMVEGDWNGAFESLHAVPARDRVKDLLTVYIAQHDRRPPMDWEGVIPLTQK